MCECVYAKLSNKSIIEAWIIVLKAFSRSTAFDFFCVFVCVVCAMLWLSAPAHARDFSPVTAAAAGCERKYVVAYNMAFACVKDAERRFAGRLAPGRDNDLLLVFLFFRGLGILKSSCAMISRALASPRGGCERC